MSIAIREHVRVAADRSVRLSHASFEPGAQAEVIVLIDPKPAIGKPHSFHDAIQAIAIDAPEDYSVRFDDEQRL